MPTLRRARPERSTPFGPSTVHHDPHVWHVGEGVQEMPEEIRLAGRHDNNGARGPRRSVAENPVLAREADPMRDIVEIQRRLLPEDAVTPRSHADHE